MITATFNFSSLAITSALTVNPLKRRRPQFSPISNAAEEKLDWHILKRTANKAAPVAKWDAENGLSWR